MALRKVLPSGARAKPPQNTVDKKPVVSPRLARLAGLAQKQGLNPFPLLVAQLVSLHHHVISNRKPVGEQYAPGEYRLVCQPMISEFFII